MPVLVTDLTGSNSLNLRWGMAAAAVSGVCLALGLLVTPAEWAGLFQHPLRDPLAETTRLGAVGLRWSLLGGAVLLPLAILACVRIAPRPVDATERSAQQSQTVWLVVAAVVAGVIVRLTRINESLWYDEIAPWMEYIKFGPGTIIGNYVDPSNHILSSVLVWASVQIFDGVSVETAFRFPALFFSIATIPAVAWMGFETGQRRVGILAAWITAIAPVFILEAANARGYAIMIATSATASAALLRACRDGGASLWILYAIVCTLGIWGHMVTVVVPIGHAIWLIVVTLRTRPSNNRPRAAALAGCIAIGLAAMFTAIVYSPVLPDIIAVRTTVDAATADQPTVFTEEGLHTFIMLGGSWSWWSSLPGLMLLIYGLFRASRHAPTREVIAVSSLGFLVFLALILILGTWMYARFALFVAPAAAVVIAVGLDAIFQRSRSLGAVACIITICVFAVDLATRPCRQPLRDSVEYVAEHIDPPRVVAVGLKQGVIQIYAPLVESLTFTAHGDGDVARVIRDTRPRAVIVYYPHILEEDDRRALEAAGFAHIRRLHGWIDWGRGSVDIYER